MDVQLPRLGERTSRGLTDGVVCSVPNAWELIDGEMLDIGPLPDWVTPGQKVMSSNGESIAHIVMVAEVNGETSVWLSLDPKYKLGMLPAQEDWEWFARDLFRVWRPV
jgi:hypothetical protein